MRTPDLLPATLRGRPFTRAEALVLGVTDSRLRARDIRRVAHGTYEALNHFGVDPGIGSADVAAADQEAPDLGLLRALCTRNPQVWVSHVTAARLYGLRLPPRFGADPIHLSGFGRSHRSPEDPPIRLHRARHAVPLADHHGISLSPPHWVFVEMAALLTVDELVVLGDQLVREPHRELEVQEEPMVGVGDLRSAVRRGKGRTGIVRAREAVELVRVGSDSPPETLMRLALVRAGLPEPELQIPLRPEDRYTPVGDAGYRDKKIVLQYEGAHHFGPEQQAKDERRNADFRADGWDVLLANRTDHRDGFAQFTRRVLQLCAIR